MGVRGPEMGGPPMLKSVEKWSGPGREGHHLLGQSLKSANPLFAAPFGFPSPFASEASPPSTEDCALLVTSPRSPDPISGPTKQTLTQGQ